MIFNTFFQALDASPCHHVGIDLDVPKPTEANQENTVSFES